MDLSNDEMSSPSSSASAMSPLLSQEDRLDILLERTDIYHDENYFTNNDNNDDVVNKIVKDNRSITSYEDMVLKTNNHVNNAKDGCNEENLELPKDMFLNSAGEEIINNEKKWFKKKKNALEAQVTFIERRVIRGLKRSLQQSTDKMRKEYNASLFQYEKKTEIK